MNKIIHIDEKNKAVTVQPGITWEQLDKKLVLKGLTLRLYPTSYPSSTVGRWLAQGGAGIGSYEYGYFRENVISARVVLGNGETREITGDELELISDTEVITGLISQVTLKLQSNEEIDVTAIACPDAHDILMKPLFPILFPRLLPMMMPKLMPVMLDKVKEIISMPDYMAEQMPDLMPKVMDNLMPHMIDDLVPLVIKPMIHYLRSIQ
jgi:hypothetical protein